MVLSIRTHKLHSSAMFCSPYFLSLKAVFVCLSIHRNKTNVKKLLTAHKSYRRKLHLAAIAKYFDWKIETSQNDKKQNRFSNKNTEESLKGRKLLRPLGGNTNTFLSVSQCFDGIILRMASNHYTVKCKCNSTMLRRSSQILMRRMRMVVVLAVGFDDNNNRCDNDSDKLMKNEHVSLAQSDTPGDTVSCELANICFAFSPFDLHNTIRWICVSEICLGKNVGWRESIFDISFFSQFFVPIEPNYFGFVSVTKKFN